jgi:hypothetical protein
MALRSHLLSLELPDASGKTVTFYTYDGYLEEHDRHKIHAEKRSLEQLKVTGGAVFGLLAYVVSTLPSRPPAGSPCPSSPSGVAVSPSPDYSPESWGASSAMTSLPSTAAAD